MSKSLPKDWLFAEELREKIRVMAVYFNKYFFVIFLVVLAATALFAQTEEGVYATSLEPLTNAAYKFVFNAETEIPANAEISIIFPPQANLSRVLHAGSNTFTGGFEVSVSQDTVKAKRARGAESIVNGTQCDFLIASIVNPSKTDQELPYNIIVKIQTDTLFTKRFNTKLGNITR